MKLRTILTTAALAAGLAAGIPAATAGASVTRHPVRPVVFIDDEHRKLTTPCVLHVGEKLTGFGYVTGTFTVTSLTPAGAVDKVTLSPAPHPAQPSEVLDFRS